MFYPSELPSKHAKTIVFIDSVFVIQNGKVHGCSPCSAGEGKETQIMIVLYPFTLYVLGNSGETSTDPTSGETSKDSEERLSSTPSWKKTSPKSKSIKNAGARSGKATHKDNDSKRQIIQIKV